MKRYLLFISLIIGFTCISCGGGGGTTPSQARDLSGLEGDWIIEEWTYGYFGKGTIDYWEWDRTDHFYTPENDRFTFTTTSVWDNPNCTWSYDGKTLIIEYSYTRDPFGYEGAATTTWTIQIRPGESLGTVSYYEQSEWKSPNCGWVDGEAFGTGTMHRPD